MDSTIAISLIVTGLIKPLILILVATFLWICLRRTSAALQHFVLSLGVIAVLLLPVLAGILPVVEGQFFPLLTNIVRVPQEWLSALIPVIINSVGEQDMIIIAGVYLLPATWLLFYLMLGVLGLSGVAKRAQPVQSEVMLAQATALCKLIGIVRPVKIMTSREVRSPQTWGLLHPIIMLPREALLWDEDKQLSVLIHELGHIARWDWLTTLLVKITCACFWFLLPIWWLAQQIFQQAEIACDDYIYKLRDRHIAYAKSLLAIASDDEDRSIRSGDGDALYMRGQSPIYFRIMSVLDKQRPHRPVSLEAAQYWFIAGGLFLILFASVQVIPLQTQLKEHVEYLLRFDFPLETPVSKEEREIKIEQFSWALLQRLKPKVQSAPAQIDNVEQISVHVARPTKQELQGLDAGTGQYKMPITIPVIDIQGFLPIVMATPEYPVAALVKGIEGWVEVVFSIDVDGKIINPQINAHYPSGIFDRTVLASLKKSHYRPQLLDGHPVIVQGVTEVFRFTLSDKQQNAVIDKRRR